jgi:Predicted hydrocarbon binding protein (contains V4R domain)
MTDMAENNAFNYYLLGLKETIGPGELTQLFKNAFQTDVPSEMTEDQMKGLREQMEALYGETGARGLAFCSGRAAFKHLLGNQSRELGFEADDFRFLPGKVKLKKGLRLMADWMERVTHASIRVESRDQQWAFQVADCPECRLGSMCDFTAGLLQEFMSWAGGGKFFRVNETSCQNRGEKYCQFLIDKRPIE